MNSNPPASNGEKLFKCDICSEAYKHLSHLSRHMQTHTGERPFKCHSCPKSFGDKAILSLHIRTHTSENVDYEMELGQNTSESKKYSYYI